MPRRCRSLVGVRHALLLIVALLDAAMPVPVVLLTDALLEALLVSPVVARDVVLLNAVLLDVVVPTFTASIAVHCRCPSCCSQARC